MRVSCPHCGYEHPLEPENFVANIDEGLQPDRAHFTCPECGGVIEERHRAGIVAKGNWVAHNPGAIDVSFYVWSAYAPFGSLGRIALGLIWPREAIQRPSRFGLTTRPAAPMSCRARRRPGKS